MSKFTTKIDNLLSEAGANKYQQKQAGTQAAIAAARAAEIAGKTDPTKKPTPVQKKLLQGLKKATMAAGKQLAKVAMSSNKPKGKVLEAEDDEFTPRKGPETGGEFEPASKDDFTQQPEEEPTPDPMTTEGETFYVNLARKSLFVDLDNVSLSDSEREAITQDVQPENAKEIAKILRKIVVDYGLSEGFDSKIDSILENFELQDLQSKLSIAANTAIEDVKKNSRVVVLVPGSFKPPHKGHYEMVKEYSQLYPDGHVHVLISAPSAKSERRTSDGKLITPDAAKQIFELYTQPLNNVTVSISQFPSPVTSAYETLKTLDPGTTVVLGASRKDNDWKRWSHAQPWAEKEGLEIDIVDPAQSAVDVTLKADGTPYSASNIRDNFDDFEKIKADIPEHIDPAQIKEIFDSL